MNRWDVINHFLSKFDNPKYLEIGVHEGVNWGKIKATDKTGVDPFPKFRDNRIRTCTSDAFFETNEQVFDVIFIDGLHHYEQVLKDFYNSQKNLSENGVILLHDCLPVLYEETIVPRVKKIGRWNGDTFKAWVSINDITNNNTYTIDFDEGIGVYINNGIEYLDFDKMLNRGSIVTWEWYCLNKHKVLSLTKDLT